MELTFDKVTCMRADDLFYELVDIFEQIYINYNHLNVSRMDFKILVISSLEIAKENLKRTDDVVEYLKTYIEKIFKEFEINKTSSKEIHKLVIKIKKKMNSKESLETSLDETSKEPTEVTPKPKQNINPKQPLEISSEVPSKKMTEVTPKPKQNISPKEPLDISLETSLKEKTRVPAISVEELTQQSSPKPTRNPIPKEKRSIDENENKKILVQYIRGIDYKKDIISLLKIIDDLENFLIENNFEFDSKLYSYLIEKNRLLYNIVEKITEHDLEELAKDYTISEFLKNLIDLLFEFNNAVESSEESTDNYDSVKIYLSGLSSKILTKEEEYELFVRIRQGDKKASEELIEHNLRLVVKIAKGYVYSGLPFLEIISEGNLGLMSAVDKFDYESGFKFSTYATWWIKQAITRFITNNSRTIRIPVHVHEVFQKIRRIQKDYESKHGREPTISEISEKSGIKEGKIIDVLNCMMPILSLNKPVENNQKQEGKEEELGDFIQSNAESPEEHADREMLKIEISNLFASAGLSDAQINVLKHRYGMYDGRLWTLDELGKKFNVTRERIRQIEEKALRKIRKNPKTKQFAVYMDDPEKALQNLNESSVPKIRLYGQQDIETQVEKEVKTEVETEVETEVDDKESSDIMKKSRKRKSVYEINDEYTVEQVDEVLGELNENEKALLHRRDGADLKNPDYSLELSEDDYRRFYGSLRTKIKRNLEKKFGTKEKIDIPKEEPTDVKPDRYASDPGLESLYKSFKSSTTIVIEDSNAIGKEDELGQQKHPVIPEDTTPTDLNPNDGKVEDTTPTDLNPNDGKVEDTTPTDLNPNDGKVEDTTITDLNPNDGMVEDTTTIDSKLNDGIVKDTTPTDLNPKDVKVEAGLISPKAIASSGEKITPEKIEDLKQIGSKENFGTQIEPTIVQEDKKSMDIDSATKILEVLNMPTFNHMYQVLGAKDAVIISLALGKVDGIFFEASKIAQFLDMTEEEVNESVKRILEVYKEYLINTINDAINVVTNKSKVLEKINNSGSN